MGKEEKAFGEVVQKVRDLLKKRGFSEKDIDDAIAGLRDWWKGIGVDPEA